MITNNDKIKCDWCGEFISNHDLLYGLSYNKMIYPSSDITEEKFESKCFNCILEEWHESDTKRELHEYLNIPFEKYKEWFDTKRGIK
jgi:hypothetical protein